VSNLLVLPFQEVC